MRTRTRTMAIVSTALSLALLSGFAITKTPVANGKLTICQNDSTDQTATSTDQLPSPVIVRRSIPRLESDISLNSVLLCCP